jgi:hypothetical protein
MYIGDCLRGFSRRGEEKGRERRKEGILRDEEYGSTVHLYIRIQHNEYHQAPF